MDFIAQHQHVLQGKYDERVEFASTPGGQCAYRRWLYRVPFVATINYSTANLDYLRSHDWLSKAGNCVVVEFDKPPVEPVPGPIALAESEAVVAPLETLRGWSAADLRAFLSSRDLKGLADICDANGVNGEDLASFDLSTAAHDLRLTPFQGRKLLASRDAFLAGEVGDGRRSR